MVFVARSQSLLVICESQVNVRSTTWLNSVSAGVIVPRSAIRFCGFEPELFEYSFAVMGWVVFILILAVTLFRR